MIAVASCDDVTTTGTGTSSLAPTTAAPEKPTERTTAPTQPTTVTPAPTTSTPKPSEPTTLSPPTAPAVYPSDDSKFPGSVSFSVNIADSNQTCLQAKLAVQFVLSISNATKFLKLEDASRADQSTCATVNETKIPLKLTFGGNNVTFVFMRDDQLTSGWLDSVHLEYRVDNGELNRVIEKAVFRNSIDSRFTHF